MLEIMVPAGELFDEQQEIFIEVPETTLRLEHSLVSVSKWEAKWKKPFLDEQGKSVDELRDYIRCMTLTQHVPPQVYTCLPVSIIDKVKVYIETDQTATWFTEQNSSSHHGVITSELIYYWMVAYQIPFECQKWHLSRLLTLIRICNIKNSEADGKHKMSKSELMARNRALNAARRKKHGTHG